MSKVIEYCTEEVNRQGHDTSSLDGLWRVGWMLDAWCWALQCNWTRPHLDLIYQIGNRVEPHRNRNFRGVGVRVGLNNCPKPEDIVPLLERLISLWPMSPLEFYKEFELIHPFVDGNGRTGKIILNGLNGTLLDPIFPPADLFKDVPYALED